MIDPARVERFLRFCRRYLVHTKGRWAGRPLELEPWQVEIVTELLGRVGPDGLRHWREALIGMPRKNGKSTLAAAIALYGLVADREPGAEVYSAACSRDQARVVFGQAAEMVRRSAVLSEVCHPYRSVIECPSTGAVYRALSADAGVAHGLNPHISVVDELHAHPSADLYEALRTASGARSQPLLLSITTAGADMGGICRKLWEKGMAGSDDRFYFRWFAAPDSADVDDPAAWKAANPASWITEDFLRSQRAGLPEDAFRRWHLNQWVTGVSRWVPREAWDACAGPPDIPEGASVVVGVDSAPKRDSTAVVVARMDADGVCHVRSWVWEASANGYLDYAAVEQFLRDLARTYDVRRMVFDPYNMTRSMLQLAAEGLAVEEFPQTDARMVPASQHLWELVTTGRLRHGGDPVLTAHSDGTVVAQTPRGWRFTKAAGRRNDAIVALAMAAWVARTVDVHEEERWAVVI